MQEQQQNGSNGLIKFLIGLFTGAAVAAPVTALVVKKICDEDKKQAVAKASEEAENRGIQAATEKAQEWIKEHSATPGRAISEPNRGISDDILAKTEEGNQIAYSVTEPNGNVTYYIYYNSDGKPIAGRYEMEKPIDPEVERQLAEIESPPEDIPDEDDLENYDLKIDDEEASQEAREFSEQHVQYLDMIERYRDSGGAIPPMTISREQFENEHIYEKNYINWYDGDDVFEENDTKIADPYYTFGFTSGNEMFSPERTANREDPDVCHVRNIRMSADFEITRVHGTYAQLIEDGEAYYNGEANSY